MSRRLFSLTIGGATPLRNLQQLGAGRSQTTGSHKEVITATRCAHGKVAIAVNTHDVGGFYRYHPALARRIDAL